MVNKNYKYTLAFIKRGDEVLMLNRNKSPWMGSWNGVGGKEEPNESAIECIKREVFEETEININVNNVFDKGVVTWNTYDSNGLGLHVYLIIVPIEFEYHTPKVTREGILDWKKISWISDFNNTGVSSNIPYFINDIINEEIRYNHYCEFEGNVIKKVTKEKI
ncbi:NUDIX hydrolase [Haploplasma axanthum]|uniref:8-oxo-dGTP diphosphatase n=1 Tax=Haploplasma axanthum TaxID=29552 RepID=A0A449BE67_HAPAX|nr:8-oxo-dGTP diphosphatase [Haploplasma axanthum]VEU80725.1 8-oxo-dGTP diphosphatase [Haploplasma axanthum]